MKILSHKLSSDFKEIELVPIGDLHIGSPNFQDKIAKREINEILSKENKFVVLNGDLIDNARGNSKANPDDNIMGVTDQKLYVVELFKPLAKEGRILAINDGNHEGYSAKNSGIRNTEEIATMLGIQDRYSEDAFLMFLRFGNYFKKNIKYKDGIRPVCYTAYGIHGSGGGRTISGKINAAMKLKQQMIADIYIMNHVHQAALFPSSTPIPDPQNDSFITINHTHIISDSLLGFDGYARKGLYAPSTNILPRAVLNGYVKRVTPYMTIDVNT